MSDTEFGNYVFRNNLTVFEALSELDVVDLHTEVEANNALIVQTRSELQATTRLLDTTVARVNTIDAVLVDVREEVGSLTSEINSIYSELQNVSQLATSASNTASSASSQAQQAATEAASASTAARAAQQSADSASDRATIALLEAQSARGSANAASTSASAAQSTANSAQSTADTALSRADQAISSFNTLNSTVNQLATAIAQASNTANQALVLANQIFAKENDLILGWGRYNNQNTLFQMRSTRTTNNIMMTNVRYTSSVRLANGSTLPYTEFWIRSPGEFGQSTYPPARVRTGQWVLYLTGGSGSAQQLFIDPFNIRDYRP